MMSDSRIDRILNSSTKAAPLALLAVFLEGCGGGSSVQSTTVNGVVSKGLLKGATVFADLDGDGIQDANEPSATTGADGTYSFTTTENVSNAALVATTDATTFDMGDGNGSTGANGVAFGAGFSLKAKAGASVISPVSTLAVSGNLSDAQIKDALGLDPGIDLATYNPFDTTAAGYDASVALGYEKAALTVFTVIKNVAAAAKTAGADAGTAGLAALNGVTSVFESTVTAGDDVDFTSSDFITDSMTETATQVTAIVNADSTGTKTAITNTTAFNDAATAIETAVAAAKTTIDSYTTVAAATSGAATVTSTTNVENTVTAEASDTEATGAIAVSGTAIEGQTLSVSETTAISDTDGAVTKAYQWQVSANGTDWTSVAGANNEDFVLNTNGTQVGQYVRVKVVSTDAAGGTTTFTSAATAAVTDNVIAEMTDYDSDTGVSYTHARGVDVANNVATVADALLMGVDNVGNTDNSNTLKIGLQSVTPGDNTVQVAIFQGDEAIALKDGDGYTTSTNESLAGISVPNDFSDLAEGEQMVVMSFTTSGTDVSGTSFDVYRHTGVAADGDGNPGIQTTKWTLPIDSSSTPISLDNASSVLYSSTAGDDHPNHWAGVEAYGNGATFNGDATDPTGSYSRVFSIESGTGYGDGVEVSFAAFTGLGAGFLSGMDNFHAKVYGSPLGNLEVKFIGSGTDSVATIDLTTYAGSTDLGNGWYDVTIPFSEFSNNAESNIDAQTGYLIGPPGDQADSTFTFYFTDTGLSSSGSLLVDMGLITSTFISMETTNDGTVTDFFPMNDAGDYYVQLNLDAALTASSGDSFTTFNVPLTVADSVYGSNNATTIDGTDGSDWLYGLGGNDTITGGAGDDVIQGGLGKDTLTGGDGADTFILSAAEAVTASADADHITDYTAGTDSLALDGGLEFADLTITDDGTDSTVTVTATGAILAIIEGDAGLAADDFA
jgi:hypothetical protein